MPEFPRNLASFWSSFRKFLVSDDEKVLVLPLPPRDVRQPMDDIDSEALRHNGLLKKKSLRHIRLRGPYLRALRVQPYPAKVFASGLQIDYDAEACTDAFSAIMYLTELRFLCLDLEYIRFPVGYIANFPKLRKLHISSTLQLPGLRDTSVQDLRIQHRGDHSTQDSTAFPVKHMQHLTRLEINFIDEFDAQGPILDFNELPVLKSLSISQSRIQQRLNVQYAGEPTLIEYLTLDHLLPSSDFFSLCHNLRHLRVIGVENATGLAPLKLESLETLELIYSPAISNIISTSYLPNLRHLLEYVRKEDITSRPQALPDLSYCAHGLQTMFLLHSERMKQEVDGDSLCFATYECNLFTFNSGQTFEHYVLSLDAPLTESTEHHSQAIRRSSQITDILGLTDTTSAFVETSA